MAVMAATYGLDLGRVDYEVYVGLAMNLPRLQMRQTFATAQGVSFALSEDQLPWTLWDGVAETEELAQEASWESNADRIFQKARRMAFGGTSRQSFSMGPFGMISG